MTSSLPKIAVLAQVAAALSGWPKRCLLANTLTHPAHWDAHSTPHYRYIDPGPCRCPLGALVLAARSLYALV